ARPATREGALLRQHRLAVPLIGRRRMRSSNRRPHMILVLGDVVSREGRTAEALALSREHVARSRLEPGCIAHAVHQDAENPRRLVFVEQWASQAALWEHFKVPASRAFAKSLGALADEPAGIAIYEAAELPLPGRNASCAGAM